MIFDNFENDEDAFRPPERRAPSLGSDADSIHRRLVEKTKRIQDGDFSIFYQLYQVDVNKFEPDNLSLDKNSAKISHRLPKGPVLERKASARNSGVSVSIGRPSMGRSSRYRQQFMETHVREDLESDSSDESHSDSFTCQSNHEVSADRVNLSERIGSICKAREEIDQSKRKQSVRSGERRPTDSKESASRRSKPYHSCHDLDRRPAPATVVKMHSYQGLIQQKRGPSKENHDEKIRSLASLEHLEKVPFGVPEESENACLICRQSFRFKQLVAELTNCLHRFHKGCIDEALKRQQEQGLLRCPTCECSL